MKDVCRDHDHVVIVDFDDPYTERIAKRALKMDKSWMIARSCSGRLDVEEDVYLGEYERCPWEVVLQGRMRANSYCVRKGLSRKAQLCKYIRKYVTKRKYQCYLAQSFPRSLVLSLWEAFGTSHMVDVGGIPASFPGFGFSVRDRVMLCCASVRIRYTKLVNV